LLARCRGGWKRITLWRHTCELKTLRLARSLGILSFFPIFLMMSVWFLLLALPVAICITTVIPDGINPFDPGKPVEAPPMYLILIAYPILVALTVCLTFSIVPLYSWFFRWTFIAIGVFFGRTALADRKEAELIAAIAAADPPT
jgi:hypothetical protein